MNYAKSLLSFAFIALMFSQCGERLISEPDQEIYSKEIGKANWFDTEMDIRVLEIDSCEYLISGAGNSRAMTHKGNCKFCEQRKTK